MGTTRLGHGACDLRLGEGAGHEGRAVLTPRVLAAAAIPAGLLRSSAAEGSDWLLGPP
jgi:hypothetical protein